jgi:hypothetical protein
VLRLARGLDADDDVENGRCCRGGGGVEAAKTFNTEASNGVTENTEIHRDRGPVGCSWCATKVVADARARGSRKPLCVSVFCVSLCCTS